jgi:pyruvate dehydrogenase E1 component
MAEDMSNSKVATEPSRDIDSEETGEWLDALEAVIDAEGVDRAHFLIENLLVKARSRGSYLPYNANTPYVNTIPADRQPHYPGDREIERRISSIIRWNALATVGQQGIAYARWSYRELSICRDSL